MVLKGKQGKSEVAQYTLEMWNLEKGMPVMTKTLDVISEAVRNNKPLNTDSRPKKAQKHRYERRKVKEYLHLGDWVTEEPA